jgi:hypothetical protein
MSSDDSGDETASLAPYWRAPYAKPWELQEYVPYLNILESLMKGFSDQNLSVTHPDWALGESANSN